MMNTTREEPNPIPAGTDLLAPSRSSELRELLRLAGPLVLSNLFFTIQISIDRLLLSWFDPAATGAAFGAAMLFYAPFMVLSGTAGFTSTFVAQYVGARQTQRVGALVAQAVWFSVIAGLAFCLLVPWGEPVLRFMGHEEHLIELEATYFRYLAFCGLPMTLTAALSGAFAGLSRPRIAVVVNVVGCVVNGVLDVWLIFGGLGVPEMGIGGAGLATVIGSFAAVLTAIAFWYRGELADEFGTRTFRFDRALARSFLSFALPAGLQGGFEVVAWTVFTLLIGGLGEAALAATGIVMLINGWFYVPMLGLAQAVCVQVGQRLGENRTDLAERSAWLGFGLAVPTMLLLGVFVALIPDVFLAIFQSRENEGLWEQTAALVPTLLWFVALYSGFDSLNLVFAFALRGAGDTRFVGMATLASGFFVLLLPAYAAIHHGGGLYGAWACATAFVASLGLVFLARFVWGPWRRMRVIEAGANRPN